MRSRAHLLPLVAAFLATVALAMGPSVGYGTASAYSPAADREVLWTQHCLAWERIVTPNTACVYGDPTSKVVVALVGDSHASHLFPAIERIARAHHWKLVVLVKVSCGFVDMRIRNLFLGREYYECATWNANVVKRLGVLRPSLTLVVNSRRAIHPVLSTQASNAAKGQALGRMLLRIPGTVRVIVDAPVARQPTATYLSLGAIERIGVAVSHDATISLTAATCSRWPCPAKVGTITKFRDLEHFTATFSRTVLGAPRGPLDRALMAVLSAPLP
jgi:hypothetical protein